MKRTTKIISGKRAERNTTKKPLRLSSETIRRLNQADLEQVAGGYLTRTITVGDCSDARLKRDIRPL